MITMRAALFSLTVVQILMCSFALGGNSNGTGDESEATTRYLMQIFGRHHHSQTTTEFSNNNSRDYKEVLSTTTPVKEYRWNVEIAPCLDGMKEVNIYCVHVQTRRKVTPYMCELKDKPANFPIRCPVRPMPEWNTKEFSACSKPCGIGIQSREIDCVIRQEGGTFEEVPPILCRQYSPDIRQYCNVKDCDIMWHTTVWGSCLNPCVQEFKYRTVECRQTMAHNHVKTWPQASCAHLPKPKSWKKCNRKHCGVEGVYIQQNHRKTEVQLTENVTATVYEGATV